MTLLDEATTGDTRLRIRWQAVAWVLGVIISALMTYNATANSMNARVAVLESQMDSMKYQMAHINDKLDRIIELARNR